MNRIWTLYLTVLVCFSLFSANLSISFAATQKGTQQLPTVPTPAPQSLTPAVPQPQSTPPVQSNLALEARLDALEKKIDTQRDTFEKDISSQKDSIGDTRNLVYILIGSLFAIIIAFLTLAWWLEQKTRKSIEAVSAKVAEAKAELDGHFQTAFADFQLRITDACQSLSHTRVSQDLLLGGKVLFWTGKPDKAIECLETALSFNQNDPEIRKFRGLCLKQIGRERRSEAIADLEYALSCDAFHNDASTHLELARAYLSSNAYAKAIDSAQLAEMNGHPSKEETQLVKADSLKGMRKYDEAMAVYDSVISANPRCTPAIMHKAEILSQEKAFDDVVALFQEGISNRGNVSKYHIFLGTAYAERNAPGDWELALQQFDEAKKASENDWDLWYYKGRAYLHRWLLSNRQGGSEPDLLDEALNHFRHGEKISRKDGTPRFINQISRLYLLSGRVDEAILEAKRSVAANRYYVQNHLTLCTALLAGKKWPEALAAANEGINCSANPPGMIWCYYFIVLAKVLQRYEFSDFRDTVAEMLRKLESAPFFDIMGWDWGITQQVIADEVSRLPDDIKRLIEDLNRSLENPATAQSVRQKWIP